MLFKLTADNFISGGCTNPIIGEVRDLPAEYGRQLVACGVAIELKEQGPALEKKNSWSIARTASTGTWLCIGSGPSLTAADCARAQRYAKQTIAVNDAWRLAQWAKIIYACDARWWNVHATEVSRNCAGVRMTHRSVDGFNDEFQIPAIARYGLAVAFGMEAPGLGRKIIHFGDNSGYQAVNIAYLFGAQRILLLGYDMQRTHGQGHFFGEHEGDLLTGVDFPLLCSLFEPLARDLESEGVEVINLSRATALRCFKRGSIDEFCSAH